jgi:hypothetical protein
VCGGRLALTRLSCPDCDTELSGVFESCDFCSLDADDREMLRVFLRSRGNMKELERHLGVSYPTARSRFDRLLARAGIEAEPGWSEATPSDGSGDRLELLEALSRGDIDVGEALTRLE